MGSMNTDSVGRAVEPARGNHTELVEIVFREDSRIEGRRPGVVYQVDPSLAHHYCEVRKVADPATKREPAPPAPVEDRAMKPPPRGRR